jgi:hypothetical protein
LHGYYEDSLLLYEPSEFMDISSIILSLGPPVAEHLYAAWRRRRGKTAQNTAGLRELIAQDVQNQLAARRIERDITWLGEYVVETLQPVFELDGSRFSANQLSAVVEALRQTLTSAGISPEFLIEQRLDPLLVVKAYLDGSDAFTKGLSPTEMEFYEACLTEMVRRMIAVADQLPGLSGSFMHDVLRSQSLIIDHGRKILQELQQLAEHNRRQDAYLVDNFNLTFRSAVLHRFTELYILGLDDDDTGFRLHIDVSYMTVRADATRSRSHTTTKSVSDIPSEDLLRRSKRLLLRGHAGSGKTTFLQWIATKSVSRGFIDQLRNFNEYVPLFVRLRDYYGKELPRGKRLLETTSPALAEMVTDNWLNDIFYRGRAIFLIDGLDEISSEQRVEVERWIKDYISITPASTFVVTSRPSAVHQDYLASLQFDEYTLKPMTPDEIYEFVNYWHEGWKALNMPDVDEESGADEKNQELAGVLRSNRHLIRLAATPLLCAVICALNFNGKLEVIEGRADLYAVATRLLYHDRPIRKKVQDPTYRRLRLEEKKRLLGEIAYWFTRNGLTAGSRAQITRRIENLLSFDGQRADTPADVGEALVTVSGVLTEVAPDTIQFLHKTFQEYFAALAVCWHEDEKYVAEMMDLRNWDELFLLVMSLTNKNKANQIVQWILARAATLGSEGTFLVLLAGRAANEIVGIDRAVREEVLTALRRLVPPKEASIVFQLAEAGEVILPFLEYSSELKDHETSYVIDVLAQINTDRSRFMVLEYLIQVNLTRVLVDKFLSATLYVDDEDFTQQILRALKGRRSRYFWRERPRGTNVYRIIQTVAVCAELATVFGLGHRRCGGGEDPGGV